MKKQINFALFLGLLFIIWLFFNTFTISQTKVQSQRIKSNTKFELAQKEIEIEKLKLSIPEYTLGSIEIGGINIPLIYEKKSGATFKYFSVEKNFGWCPFLYQWQGFSEFTPEDFYRTYISKQLESETLQKSESKKEN